MKFNQEIQEKVTSLFAHYAKPDSPGYVVGILVDQEVVYSQGFGQATLEHPSPITADTVFDIGSMAKQFVGMAIALLEDEGRLSIHDNLRDYLPEFPDYGHEITIANLLFHTSGIRNYTVLAYYMMGYHESDAISREEVFDLLMRLRSTNFEPGCRWEYSDSNYFLLGEIIERITQMSLDDYTQEAIFRPLNMQNTLFRQCHSQVIKNRAMSYVNHPITFRSPYLYRHPNDPSSSWHTLISNYEHVGAEGLFTTLGDLIHWDRNFQDNRLGKGNSDLIKRVLSPGAQVNELIGYGFGINVGSYKGKRFYGHDGAMHGYTSSMMHFPDEKVTLICLSNHNLEGSWDYRDRMIDILFPSQDAKIPPEQAPPSVTNPGFSLSADELLEYAGDYRSQELKTTFHVAVDQPGLILRNTNKHCCSMDLAYTPTLKDHFVAYDPHPVSSQITFLRKGDRIEAFIYRDFDGDGREAIRFEKNMSTLL